MKHTDVPALDIALLVPALALPLACLDLAARSMQTWVEWQQGLWQPCLDLQGQWLAALSLQAGWPAFLPRGTEQLA